MSSELYLKCTECSETEAVSVEVIYSDRFTIENEFIDMVCNDCFGSAT